MERNELGRLVLCFGLEPRGKCREDFGDAPSETGLELAGKMVAVSLLAGLSHIVFGDAVIELGHRLLLCLISLVGVMRVL
jgi:hypothetical protein